MVSKICNPPRTQHRGELGGQEDSYAYILQGRGLGLGPRGLPVGGRLVEGDLRRAGPQGRWVADALGWAAGKAGGVIVGVLGVRGLVVGVVLGAGLLFSLVEIGSSGEDVLDQSARGAPGLDGGRWVLLLLLLLLLMVMVGLLVVKLLVVSEGWLRGGITVGPGEVFERGTEGGVWLDGGGYLVISLRL